MARKRVGVLISGTGTTMASLLYASKSPECPYELVLVASNKPEARGLRLAAAEGIATFAHTHKGLTREAHEAVLNAALRNADVEYVALAGYMRVLSPWFVEQWSGRMINTHPALLPKYKGLETHARALAARDAVAGCSVHIVTPELDDGPVIGQIEVAVLPDDTPETLGARVLLAEYQLFPRALATLVTR